MTQILGSKKPLELSLLLSNCPHTIIFKAEWGTLKQEHSLKNIIFLSLKI